MPPLIAHCHLYERIDPATGDRLASSRVTYNAPRWFVLDTDGRPLSTHADSREARHAARQYLAGLPIDDDPEPDLVSRPSPSQSEESDHARDDLQHVFPLPVPHPTTRTWLRP